MDISDSTAKLCIVCSKLDIKRLANPLYPCRNPLPCSTPPARREHDIYLTLGSVDEINGRRFICNICKLIAENLDKESLDLGGECRMKHSRQFCTFRLPRDVKARDPNITHFHFTQLTVVFDPPTADRFLGPSLPWEMKERDNQTSRYILNFQVKARSCIETGDSTVASPQTEQEFLDTIGGRYVSTQVNPHLVRRWLHQCEHEHGKYCTPSLGLATRVGGVPTFVVDVVQSCIVDTPPQCRYVALSYVWGKAPVFKHLLENTRDIRKTNSLRTFHIPATIRDAMTLVRSIGERYLWVDSLCIIQNDLKMQQVEITRMGSIYSDALFTIVAAAGDHADSGLPGVEEGTREQVQKILKLADYELLTVVDIHRKQSGIDGTVWAQRAWTFQERALSNRMLVFSENQVYWSCRLASHSEERTLEEVRDIDQLHPSFPQNPYSDPLSWERLQPSEYRNIYCDQLANYRQRRLSYQTDMLNAFSGVSEILSVVQGDAFIWGLPESLFSFAMTWNFTGHSSRNHVEVPLFDNTGSQYTIPIPSWSWAAWSGLDPDYPPFLHGGNGSQVRPVVQFDIVDGTHQLVEIKERPSREDRSASHVPTLWKSERSQQLQSEVQPFVSRIGQLRFWTSLANLRTIRRWRIQGPGQAEFIPHASPYFESLLGNPSYHTEIVHQDFIVIAAGGPETLILLVVEWKEGVAYRVGITDLREEDWLRVENRQWRCITLG